MASVEERARSFGALATRYDRTRPSYPAEALRAALPAGARRVADVGAGTGKLTAVLASLGLEVVAVEPDEKMGAVLASRLPGVELRAGSAESLPLEDASFDAVFFGQSWHWVEPVAAGAEAHRVLRPGGVLALVWNMTDDRTEWVAQLRSLTRSEARISQFRPPKPPEGFCEGHRQDTESTQRLSRAELLELVSTWSAVSTLPPEEREGVMDAVAKLLASDPTLAGREAIELPHICVDCFSHRL